MASLPVQNLIILHKIKIAVLKFNFLMKKEVVFYQNEEYHDYKKEIPLIFISWLFECSKSWNRNIANFDSQRGMKKLDSNN